MTHWEHAETPFGNIIYSLGTPTFLKDDPTAGPSHVKAYIMGAGSLPAEVALKLDFRGDRVPDFDALKDHARAVAEAAGQPFAEWFSPNPALRINGKDYYSSVTAVFYDAEQQARGHDHYAGRVAIEGAREFTQAAANKLSTWLNEHRQELIEGDPAERAGDDRAVEAARSARAELERAERALRQAKINAQSAESALVARGLRVSADGRAQR